jgi:MFS family permease
MGQTLDIKGYTAEESGFLGVLLVIAGIVGSFIVGVVGDWLQNRHVALVYVCMIGTTASLVFYSLVSIQSRRMPLLSVACACLGLFMTSVIPLTLDLAAESAYPIPETTTSAVIMTSGQVFGIIFITALSFLEPSTQSLNVSNWCHTGATVAALVVMTQFRGKFLRQDAEKAQLSRRDEH